MICKIHFKINGENVHLNVDTQRTLLDVIRNDLGLKGTKDGCGEGQCGACTILLDGQAVNSCLILARDADGREILTIEGLASKDGLHPLQSSFIKEGAVQCGFCTSGAILSAKALLDKNPYPTEEEVRRAIAGNLCRCTGYAKIVKAILAVSRNDRG
jgi:carbon-monoxide dehydrogenase small subunit